MSQVKIQGNALGTGIFTIASPNSNNNQTLTLPDQTGTVLTNTGPFTANAATPNGAVSVDASNNVTVGTTATTYNYQTKNIALYDATSAGVSIVGGARVLTLTAQNAGGIYMGARTADPVIFTTNDVERARFDSAGRFLVGTNTSPTNAGGVVVANNELFVYNIPTTASGANCSISSGENNRFYRSTSALKYKQNIRDLESIDLGKFRPVRYNSKCENDDQTKEHFGIIADEVAAAGVEELVTRGVEGEIEGFQYERLTVVLLKHCQEQQALIESLTARIAALEGAQA